MISFQDAQKFTDRTLIESLISSFYIVDYGFINKVNADKTVNVTHAKKQVLLDGSELPVIETPNIEVLTICGAGFSLQFDYKAGDKVLLLGLKDFVKKVAEVKNAETPEIFIHYNRTTLKALPLCVFSDEAKVKIQIENGKMTIDTEGNIELNGNDKQFVTWTELNKALQNFITTFNSHTHTGNMGSPTSPPVVSAQLDISSAKTKTILTGG